MPGIDGYELTKNIRVNTLVPIIHLTAMGETENVIHGLEIGADDYLGKPFEPKELLLRIKNYLCNSPVYTKNVVTECVYSQLSCRTHTRCQT